MRMRRPTTFSSTSDDNDYLIPSSFVNQNPSNIYKPLKKNSPVLTLAKLSFALLCGYQVLHMLTSSFWKDNKRASKRLYPIYESRNCAKVKNIDPVNYNLHWWENSSNALTKQGGRMDPKFIESNAPDSFEPPYEARQSGNRRGIFATRDIKKGEIIYGKTEQYGYFASGRAFQHFLKKLPSDSEACDFLYWARPLRNFGPKGQSAIVLAMDEYSFIKRGGPEKGNVGCIEGKDCRVDKYALRAIGRGEELFSEDEPFTFMAGADKDVWPDFGL